MWSPKSYVFDGTGGSLGGAMKLVKAGAGALTISGNHCFTGKTTVWDGALLVNGDSARQRGHGLGRHVGRRAFGGS